MVETYKKAHYQIEPFTCSQNIDILESVSRLNVYTALFISTVLNETIKDVFPYMRSCKKKSINDLVIHLPQTPKGKPDWLWMENYMKSLPYSDRIE